MKYTYVKKAKQAICIMLVLCCTVMMSACSLSDITKLFRDFDAQGYTQSFLDAIVKKDFSEYAEITNSSEETAKKEYETLLDSSTTNFLSAMTVSDATRQEVRTMFDTIYSKWHYEVGEATKNDDDSFTVPVTLRQLKAFTGALQTTQDEFTKEAKKKPNLTQNDYYDLYCKIFIDAVNKNIEKGNYGEPAVVNVKVAPTAADKNVFEISRDSIQQMYNAAVDASVLQEESSDITGNK